MWCGCVACFLQCVHVVKLLLRDSSELIEWNAMEFIVFFAFFSFLPPQCQSFLTPRRDVSKLEFETIYICICIYMYLFTILSYLCRQTDGWNDIASTLTPGYHVYFSFGDISRWPVTCFMNWNGSWSKVRTTSPSSLITFFWTLSKMFY